MKVKFILLLMICPLFLRGQIITTIAGSGLDTGFNNGSFCGDNEQATNACFFNPVAVTIDTKGNIYIADDVNERIRKIDSTGIIRTIAGTGAYGYGGDGGPATAAIFGELAYIFAEGDSVLLIPDDDNYRVRKICFATGKINTIAGTGTAGISGDGGPATTAEICTPFGVCSDKYGNIYFADVACHRVRKIDTAGIIWPVAGDSVAGFLGDGGLADTASLYHTINVIVDIHNNIYIIDAGNNRVRKVDTNGIISTFAGNGGWGYSGDNGPATNATFDYLESIATDGGGNVYVSDCFNNVIRKIDTAGIITTVAGNGYNAGSGYGGFSGDGGPATDAQLNHPEGLAFDKYGNLYIADWLNNRIRKVTNVGVPLGVRGVESGERGEPGSVSVYPNPASGQVTISSSEVINQVAISNFVGQCVFEQLFSNNKVVVDMGDLPKGIYFVRVNGVVVKKLLKE